MTYVAVRRRVARMEANALRGYARWGVMPSKAQPLDYWAEFRRSLKINETSRRK